MTASSKAASQALRTPSRNPVPFRRDRDGTRPLHGITGPIPPKMPDLAGK